MTKHTCVAFALSLLASSGWAQSTPAPATVPSESVAEDAASSAPRLEPAVERLLSDRRDPYGRRCQLRAFVSSGALRHLACGEAGVWTVRLAANGAVQLVEQRATEGAANGFFVREGSLWVETLNVRAERMLPIDPDAKVFVAGRTGFLPGAPAPSGVPGALRPAPVQPPAAVAPQPVPTPQPPPAPQAKPSPAVIDPELERLDGRVIALEPGFAIIDLGSLHGVTPGERVAFDQVVTERVDDEQVAKRRERLAVGTARAIASRRARVELGLDERVPVGALAYTTHDPSTGRSFAPPRSAGLWHVGFVARPFLIVEDLGAGVILDARAGYRLESPLHLEAFLQPLAFAGGRDGLVVPFAALVMASFDSRLFEVGLGIGGQTMLDPQFDLEAGSGTTIAQRMRLGAVDGGMIEIFSHIVLFHSEFEFSDLRVNGQLPLGDSAWLLLQGGGGSTGMSFAEIGLRVLMHGNGDRGSLFFSALVGGVHVFEEVFCESQASNCDVVDYTGPMVGAGAEFRL
jgi:hypothetical protein